MNQAEKMEIARTMLDEGRLKHRQLGAEIRARGGTTSSDEVRDLYRAAIGKPPKTDEERASAAQTGEPSMLPGALRDSIGKLEMGIVSHVAMVRADEAERARSEVEHMKAEHAAQLREVEGELATIHAELEETGEELDEARRQLAREREEVASLRATLTEAEQARTKEAERHRSELSELSERFRTTAHELRAAETAVERAEGKMASITTDRDAARVRVGELETRIQEERDTRTRAEGARDAARQQAEVMRESALELRARLEATEEIQRQLQATLQRLGRHGRGSKT